MIEGLEEQILTTCLNEYELKIARGNPDSFETQVAVQMAHERWRTQEFWWGKFKETYAAKIFEAINKLCMDNNRVDIVVAEFTDYDHMGYPTIRRVGFVDNKGDLIYSQATLYEMSNKKQLSAGLLRGVNHTRIEKVMTLEEAVKELLENGDEDDA